MKQYILKYILNILVGIDQLFTTLIGGYPDETLSSYAYRLDNKNKLLGQIFRPIIDFLFSWENVQGGHCYNAYLAERKRVNLPPDLR